MTDDQKIEAFRAILEKTASEIRERVQYMAYGYPSRRSVFITHIGSTVRVNRGLTELIETATKIFGPENGTASEEGGAQQRVATWKFNGYPDRLTGRLL
jgi:hypothetical protein